jgi:hypothetical protein
MVMAKILHSNGLVSLTAAQNAYLRELKPALCGKHRSSYRISNDIKQATNTGILHYVQDDDVEQLQGKQYRS